MLGQIWQRTKREIYPRINYRLVKLLKRNYLDSRNFKLEKLGSQYGGWTIPTDMISANSVCYSGGIGEDVTFDQQLIDRFKCNVYGFDPTPRAIKHIEKNKEKLGPNFHFFEVGLWSKESELKFYSPQDPRSVSHSVEFKNDSGDFFIAKCKNLPTLMRELGHDRIDLLKIDIEGAEYEVLQNVIENRLAITILCVEYDQPTPFWKMYHSIKLILNNGYKLIAIDDWNFTFVQKDPLK